MVRYMLKPAYPAVIFTEVGYNTTGVQRIYGYPGSLQTPGKFIGEKNIRKLGLRISLFAYIFFLALQVIKIYL